MSPSETTSEATGVFRSRIVARNSRASDSVSTRPPMSYFRTSRSVSEAMARIISGMSRRPQYCPLTSKE